MGSFTGASQKGWYLKLDYSYTQDISANTSTITTTLSIYDATGYSQNSSANEAYYLIQGEKRWNPYNYGSAGWYGLGSKSWTVSHNADGTASVTLTGEWDCGFTSSYTPRHLSVSGVLTLPTIPRATTPTIGAVTLGSAATINLPRASSSFTHTLTYQFGSASGTIATGAGASATWTPPLTLANQIPNAVSGTGTITCYTYTYNGSTLIGTKTISFTASVPASVKPTISACTVSPVNGNTWIAGKGIYVAGFSTAKVQTTAAGIYSSTIKAISITGDAGTGSGADWTSGTLTAGAKTLTVTATDSRGRTAGATHSITVQPYAPPAISNLSYQRGSYVGGVWTDNAGGEDIKVTFALGLSLTAYSNVASLSVAVEGETTQTTTGAAAGAKTYYFKTIGVDVSRLLTVTAVDSTGTSAGMTRDIPTIAVPLNFNRELNSIRIGGVAEDADTFRCSLAAKFDKPITASGGVKMGDVALDYPIARGTFGIWTYEKWASGVAKCYGSFSLAHHGSSFNMPFAFTHVYSTQVSPYYNQVSSMLPNYAFELYANATSGALYAVLSNGTASTETTLAGYIEVVGRWKE